MAASIAPRGSWGHAQPCVINGLLVAPLLDLPLISCVVKKPLLVRARQQGHDAAVIEVKDFSQHVLEGFPQRVVVSTVIVGMPWVIVWGSRFALRLSV